jgi:uncharacterized protein involved in type VI secretion and phage assembly
MSEYFGKYRGTVVNNVDPMQMGRLMVQVPDVFGSASPPWAMPCVPFAGVQSGFYVVPTIGASVWVEFERGDSSFPVWVGGFWSSGAQVPVSALSGSGGGQTLVMQTVGQNELVLSDAPGPAGGVLLRTASGAVISVNDAGITISNGKGAMITLAGTEVIVNNKIVKNKKVL